MSHSWWACLVGPWSIYSQLSELVGFFIFLPSLLFHIARSVPMSSFVSLVGSGINLYYKHRWFWYRRKKKKKKRSGSRKHRNRYRRFRRYAVPFHLVERCRRRYGNRPSTVSKKRLQSTPDARHARWRRRLWNSKGRYMFKKWIGYPSWFGTKGYVPNGRTQAPLYYSSSSPPKPFQPSEIDPSLLDEFVKCGNFLDIVHMLNGLPQQDHKKNVTELFGRLDEHSLKFGKTSPTAEPPPGLHRVNAAIFHRANGSGCHNNSTPSSSGPDFFDTPLIWDSGASFGLTPFRADFIHYEKVEIPVKDVTKTNIVQGMGTVMYKVKNSRNEDVFIPGLAYHLPTTDVRLMSPQAYHQLYGGESNLNGDRVIMDLGGGTSILEIPIDKQTNLPILRGVHCTQEEKEKYGYKFRAATAYLRRRKGFFMGKWCTTQEDIHGSVDLDVDYEFDTYMHRAHPCVSHSKNENLSAAEKELLLLHWKLGIGLGHCQQLLREHKTKDRDGNVQIHPPFIEPRIKSAAYCKLPKCPTCMLSRAKKKGSPKPRTRTKADKKKEHLLAHDMYEPGDCVMTDEYEVPIGGRSLSGYGKGSESGLYTGGGMYVDVASGYIHHEFIMNGDADESLMSKKRFEQDLQDFGIEVKRYHSDNGIFASKAWKEECILKGQKQTFSGVGAQFENGVAERAIQTIMWMARSYMLHCSLRWQEHDCDSTSLWPFAVNYAIYIYNRVPGKYSGLSPLERLSGIKQDNREILRAHVWGCPVYVLDPRLQDGKKIPKFEKRARLGQFLGFSRDHSSNVALCRHLGTGYVSPQWHCVFDDLFQTVFHNGRCSNAKIDEICEQLFAEARDWYVEPERDEDGKLVYDVPPLDEIWLTEGERRERRNRIEQQKERDRKRIKLEEELVRDLLPVLPEDDKTIKFEEGCVVFEEDADSSGEDPTLGDPPDPQLESEGEDPDIVEEDPESAEAAEKWRGTRRSERLRNKNPMDSLATNTTTWEDVMQFSPRQLVHLSNQERSSLSPALYRRLHKHYNVTFGDQNPPPSVKSLSRKRRKYNQRVKARIEEADRTLLQMELNGMPSVNALMNSPLGNFVTIAAKDSGYSGSIEHLICAAVDPMFLKAKAEASKEDNPNWSQAMNGPHREEYWDASRVEMATLERMDTYEVVDRPQNRNILQTTWVLRLKRYPDGRPKKFKARLCARGDQQNLDEDYTETYSPTAQWTTIRMMLLLEILLGLKSLQGDVAAAFLHGELEEHETVYCEMPVGFRQAGKVWKLKKSLYGLRQAPLCFFKYLTKSMTWCGLKQSTFDPCCFIGDKVICVTFVDDCLFFARDKKDINALCDQLRHSDNPNRLELEEEGDAAGFLGVDIKREDGKIVMTQTGLIDRIIAALGLDGKDGYGKFTPAAPTPLTKDLDGDPPEGVFNYSSVVGMTLYLAGHTRPDIAYAINCCARYMFNPRRSHEIALKRIGRYLKATRDKGLIMKPNVDHLKIDAWPDADFAGLFNAEKHDDPMCVKSRTGYVIQVADCPIIWKSQLQSNRTALSTMEAEITALASCCRELFPIMDMAKELGKVYGVKADDTTMNVSIHEDNAGALLLAETIPPNFTPRSKWYHVETIWFREQIAKRGIKLLKCPTVDQLGDIFTKGLTRTTFEHLRRKLCGW